MLVQKMFTEISVRGALSNKPRPVLHRQFFRGFGTKELRLNFWIELCLL
jgi:hypothetical protein